MNEMSGYVTCDEFELSFYLIYYALVEILDRSIEVVQLEYDWGLIAGNASSNQLTKNSLCNRS